MMFTATLAALVTFFLFAYHTYMNYISNTAAFKFRGRRVFVAYRKQLLLWVIALLHHKAVI